MWTIWEFLLTSFLEEKLNTFLNKEIKMECVLLFSLYFNLILLDGSQKLPWMEEVEWINSKGTTVIVKCTADTESKLK